ncbi:uncharacterized protein LOC121387463 isoform X2 [Gigantopelta aegis]|nr:uncharacterized protein LOC121387463 isoform X2 [Gigantopelta aegis]
MPVLTEHVSSLPPQSAYMTATNFEHHVINLPRQEPQKLVSTLTSDWKRLFKGPTWQRAHLPGKEPCRKLQSLPWDGLKTSLSQDETRRLSRQEAKRVEVPPNRTTLLRQKLAHAAKEEGREKQAQERYLQGIAPPSMYMSASSYALPTRHPAPLYPPASARHTESGAREMQPIPQTLTSELRKKVVLTSIEQGKKNDCWQKIEEMRQKMRTSAVRDRYHFGQSHEKKESQPRDRESPDIYSDSPGKYEKLIKYRPPVRSRSADTFGSRPAYLSQDMSICETRTSRLRKQRILLDKEKDEQTRCGSPDRPGSPRPLRRRHDVQVNQTLTSEMRRRLADEIDHKHVCLWRQVHSEAVIEEPKSEEKKLDFGCQSASRYVHFIYDGIHNQYRPYPISNKAIYQGGKYKKVDKYRSLRSRFALDDYYNFDSRQKRGIQKNGSLTLNGNYRSKNAWIRSEPYEKYYKKPAYLMRLMYAYEEENRRRLRDEEAEIERLRNAQESVCSAKRKLSVKKVVSSKVSSTGKSKKTKQKGRGKKSRMWKFTPDEPNYKPLSLCASAFAPFQIDNYSYNNMYYYIPPSKPDGEKENKKVLCDDIKKQSHTQKPIKVVAKKCNLNSHMKLPSIHHKAGRM